MQSELIVVHEGKEHRIPDVRRCSMQDGWLTLYDDDRNSLGCFYRPSGYYFSVDVEFKVTPTWPQRRED